MLGTYRTILAIMVVFQHLGKLRSLGAYAVFAFFVISGYLMTFILNENYGFSTTGKFKYLFNRFLRIYPPYWGAVIFSVVLVFAIDQEVIDVITRAIRLPHNYEHLFRNIFIIFERGSKIRLVPPSWALTVEIFYYLLMVLGISRSKKSSIAWFSISLIYTIGINILGADWHFIYFFFAAGSLPFSIGALIFHFRDQIHKRYYWLKYKYTPTFLIVLVAINYWLSIELKVHKHEGFYVNLILNSILFVSLLSQESLPGISRSLDRKIGDYSYPIYLLHIQAGVIVYALTGLKEGNLFFVCLSIPLILLLSWGLDRLIVKPSEIIRRKVKDTNQFKWAKDKGKVPTL